MWKRNQLLSCWPWSVCARWRRAGLIIILSRMLALSLQRNFPTAVAIDSAGISWWFHKPSWHITNVMCEACSITKSAIQCGTLSTEILLSCFCFLSIMRRESGSIHQQIMSPMLLYKFWDTTSGIIRECPRPIWGQLFLVVYEVCCVSKPKRTWTMNTHHTSSWLLMIKILQWK